MAKTTKLRVRKASDIKNTFDELAAGRTVLLTDSEGALFAQLIPHKVTNKAYMAIMIHNEALGWRSSDTDMSITRNSDNKSISVTVMYLTEAPEEPISLNSALRSFLQVFDLLRQLDIIQDKPTP